MTRALAVEFRSHGQLHYLALPAKDDRKYSVGDLVLYPTHGGNEVATVAWHGEVDLPEDVPCCKGIATDEDLRRHESNQNKRAEIDELARKLIAQHGLSMKLLAVDYLEDAYCEELSFHASQKTALADASETNSKTHFTKDIGQVAVLYYQSPRRVDFRALLPDLARNLRCRVDLRQIGARDAMRISGGVGPCGRPLCCTWMRQVDPVSMRLAREQNIVGPTAQRCGACGHAMCCLRFEQSSYQDFAARMPAVGESVDTPRGTGTVIGHQMPADAVLVRGENGERFSCPAGQINKCACASRLRNKNGGVADEQKKPVTKPRKQRWSSAQRRHENGNS